MSTGCPHARARRALVLVALLIPCLVLAASAGARDVRFGQRTLRQGARGHDVRVLQRHLSLVGFRAAVDGVYGPGTARVVRRFQAAARRPVTGVVTGPDARAVERALRGGPGDRRSLGVRRLRSGLRGHDVRVLQDLLTRAGFRTPVDGMFGPTTRRGVRAFERAHRRTVDGVVTSADARTLHAAAAHRRSAPTRDRLIGASAPGSSARLTSAGLALAPADAPQAVKDVIAAGNRIALKPYRYGGGHASFSDGGYDCSGSVSYALHGGGLLARPLPSSGFYGFGSAGGGRWITVYANGGHMYMVVAGLRFDTSSHGAGDSRWTDAQRSSAGYRVRHPDGL